MSSLLSSALSHPDLTKKDPFPSRPKHFVAVVAPPTPDSENEFENMMTDSTTACTPALDFEYDSGDDADDSELSMLSPISPPSFQLVSILHRKRKGSQEHGTSVHFLDPSQGQQEVGLAAAPAPESYGKGANSRRPTVTFDLDVNEPSSAPKTRKTRFTMEPNQLSDVRHDDDDGDSQEIMSGAHSPSNPETQDNLTQAEQAFRRVSISPIDGLACHAQDPVSTSDMTAAVATPIDKRRSSQDALLSHVLGAAPQDMLVALFERSSELEALAARHSDFFNLMYCSLPKTCRDKFKELLFKSRDELCDRDWMNAIKVQLSPLPSCILEKFKGMVGWSGPDSEEDDHERWGEDKYGCRDSSFEQVQIKWLRDINDFSLETFKKGYPQFFVNAREKLQGRRMSHGGDQRDQYVIFCETLGLSRSQLSCDSAWARRMNCCLEKHPELLLQLKEIIAYEVGYDD
ncbi:hypothetical protein EDD21DRAFT_354849 [Dissophora ornata]|nr:hypothetical protein BGZ58_009831 [Dissophora ornata]KAI8600107.1 hypothetical protein EDD21DRAFT_354849 [Dissophora ornata]